MKDLIGKDSGEITLYRRGLYEKHLTLQKSTYYLNSGIELSADY